MLWVLAGGARASAESDTHYQDTIIGERAAGMGGAFTALANEATGAAYNPAGTAVDGSTLIQLSMSAYKLRRHRVTVADLCGETLAEDEGGLFGFPASLGFVKLLSSETIRHAVGLTLTIPHADRSNQGGVLEDLRCGQVGLSSGLAAVSVDRVFVGRLSYAVRPWRWLSAGVSLGVAARDFSATSMAMLTLSDGSIASTHPSAQLTSIDATLWRLFVQFGVIVEPLAGLRLGVSLTTPYISLAGTGKLHVVLATAEPDDWQSTQVAAIDDASYQWKVPLRLAGGVAYTYAGRFTLAVDVSLHFPVAPYAAVEPRPELPAEFFADTHLERELVLNVNAGAEVRLNRWLVLRGGFFTNFTSHPALAPGEPAFSDHVDYFGWTIGASFASSASSSFGVAIQTQVGHGEVQTFKLEPAAAPEMLRSTEGIADVDALSLIVAVGGNFDLR